jgi:hypothetical protein
MTLIKHCGATGGVEITASQADDTAKLKSANVSVG